MENFGGGLAAAGRECAAEAFLLTLGKIFIIGTDHLNKLSKARAITRSAGAD